MAYFYQWETKSFNIYLRNKDGEPLPEHPLEGWRQVIVSLGQGHREKVVFVAKAEGETDEGISVDVENDLISIHLSQEQTGEFKEGECELQANFYYFDHERDTSSEATIEVLHNLHKKVVD